MNVYEALMRDGRKKRGEGEFAEAHEFVPDCDCRDCATTQRDRLGLALFQMQEAAKDLAQREQKLLAGLTALLPGTHYMDPPDGGSVTLLEQLERMAKDAKRYRRSLRDRPTSEPGGCECSRCGCIFIGGPVHDVCGVCKAAQDGTGPDYVSPVTECEACLTEDACRIRGQCAHYLRERGSKRAAAHLCDRFSREQIMDAMIEAEVGDGAFKTMLLKMDELEAQARQTLAGRERPNV